MDLFIVAICFLGLPSIFQCQLSGQYQIGDFSLQWADRGNTVDFKFLTSQIGPLNMWSAFAFSNDRFMVSQLGLCFQQQGNSERCFGANRAMMTSACASKAALIRSTTIETLPNDSQFPCQHPTCRSAFQTFESAQ